MLAMVNLAQEGVPEDVLDPLSEGDPEVKVRPGL
jgi:hypothetical protein